MQLSMSSSIYYRIVSFNLKYSIFQHMTKSEVTIWLIVSWSSSVTHSRLCNTNKTMLNKILSCREAAQIILYQLSMKDNVNLASTIPENYMYYLHTSVNERERDLILMEIFDRVPLEKFKDQTLECLYKRYWRYVSRFAKMKENFIIKWFHKIDFMLLKQNAFRRCYKNYVSTPRPFSRRFHKLFPGFKDYWPCHWCWVDRQWFLDIDTSRPINMCVYNFFAQTLGVGKAQYLWTLLFWEVVFK